jgi:hypothetical protein
MKSLAAIQRRQRFLKWLQDPQNQPAIAFSLARCGYVPVCNPESEDGRWMVNGALEVIYVKANPSSGGTAHRRPQNSSS